MEPFWSTGVAGLKPYTPGEQPVIAGLVKLNTNENPYPPSPAALAAIRAATDDDLRLYPDPESRQLKKAVADLNQLAVDNVFVGNGSDEVLAHAFRALLKHELPILFPDITYSFYPVYCGLYDIAFATVALDQNFQVNVSDYARPNGGVVLPNPNAPTGCALSRAEIRRLLESNTDSVVVIDEAYIDFGAQSCASLIHEFPNLLVIQTLSKSRSLAGLRIGFALGHPALIEALERVKGSFNSYPIDRLASVGAVAALDDQAYFEQCCSKIIASRNCLTFELTALGFDVLPSCANFIFARHPQQDGAALLAALRARKILLRHFKLPSIEQFLRISVGSDEECQVLVSALKDILAAGA